MSNITINTTNLRGALAPLYCRYPQQINPQPAYVEINETGNVFADYSGEIGNGVSSYVWHGRTIRWGVPPTVRGDDLADIMESDEVRELLDRVHAGHTIEWDGSNFVGRLDDDASAASDDLDRIFSEMDGGSVWNAMEWMDGAGLLGNWDEQPLAEAVAEVERVARSENVYLDGDVETELLDWAESHFGNVGRAYVPTLNNYHLRALVDDERITVEEARAYAAEQGIDFVANND